MQYFVLRLTLVLLFFGQTLLLKSQQIDSDFKPTIYSTGWMSVAAEQQGGKIIVVGNFEKFDGVPAKRIVRLNANGTVDESFDIGTGPDYGVYVTNINNVLIQNDNKILLAGSFSSFDGFDRQRIVRLNVDGSVDQGFVPPPNSEEIGTNIYPLAIQSNGKILYRQSLPDLTQIVRLNVDGSIDESFTLSMIGFPYEIAELPSGNIMIVGAEEINGASVNDIAIVNSDGTLNETFNYNGSGNVRGLAVQADGKILLNSRSNIFRVNEDGTIDQTFTKGIPGGLDIYDIKIGESGEIFASGEDGKIWKMSQTGALEETYNLSGLSSRFIVANLTVLNNGDVLGAGNGNRNDSQLIRLNSQLQIGSSFDIGFGPLNPGAVSKGAVQSDGKIVLVGDFGYYDGVKHNGIIRLNTDLSFDETFNAGYGFNESFAIFFSIVTLNDKLIIGGQFNEYDGTSVDRILRLNQDGTLDTSFKLDDSINSGSFSGGQAMVQSDGKLIFNHFNKIIRLNIDGSIDNSFTKTFDSSNLIFERQDDGKLLISGGFTELNGETIQGSFIRLNTDGSVDASFEADISDTWTIRTIIPQTHGKILLAGEFLFNNGTTTHVIRLGHSGELDPSFIVSSADKGISSRAYLLADESVLVSGLDSLKRITPRGEKLSLELAYSEFGYLQGIVPMESSFLALGTFTSIGGEQRDGLAHYRYESLPDSPLAPQELTFTTDASGYPKLTWSDNAIDESGYLLFRAVDEESIVFELDANISSFRDMSVEPNTTYRYWIEAFNSGGESMQSNEVSVEVGLITSLDKSSTIPIQAYPNPGKDIFTLNLLDGGALIQVLNSKGALLRTIELENGETKIDLSNESDGLYYLQLIQKNMSLIKVLKKN